MRAAALVLSLLVGVAADAFAQTPNRNFVQGVGGVTLGTGSSEMFGGGIGISLGRHLGVVAEAGRMNDVLPTSVRNDIDGQMEQIGREFGVSVRADVHAPATYWAAGLRAVGSPRGRFLPFALVTVGSARISPRFSLELEGRSVSPSDEDMKEAGLTSGTEPLVGVGGGVEVAVARRLAVALGYQFNRIFTKDPAVNLHRLYTGLNVRF